jgi:hypothetical protein
MGGVGSGDRLARGVNRVTYSTTETKVTDEKWADMFGDFDPEKFKNEPAKSKLKADGSHPDLPTSGDAGAESAEVIPGDRPEIDGFGN